MANTIGAYSRDGVNDIGAYEFFSGGGGGGPVASGFRRRRREQIVRRQRAQQIGARELWWGRRYRT